MKKTLSFLLLLSLGTSVLADHRITMRTTMADPALSTMRITSVTSTKDKRQRVEDVTDVNGMKTTSVRLIMCDREQEAELDPEAKVYTIRSLRPSLMTPDGEMTRKTKEGHGKIVSHFEVENKGREKVANFDARHWVVNSKMVGSGCIGSFDMTTKREIWTAPLPVFACPIVTGEWSNVDMGGCQVTNEMTGDVAEYQEAASEQVVKEIYYQDGKPLMTREVVDFSTAELDDALFSLDGYRQVSREEFDKLRQERMMKVYMQQ